MPNSSKRINWIDLARFFGIFAIVYGHTIQFGNSNHFVYSFHVPLFFLLQGCAAACSDQTKNKPFEFIKKKAFTLLLPYYCFAIISTGIIFIASRFITFEEASIFNSPLVLVWDILRGYTVSNRPLWFLPCSFVLSLITYFALLAIKKSKSPIIKKGLLPFLAIFGALALLLSEELSYNVVLPYYFETAIYMLPFFVIGYLLIDKGLIQLASQSKPRGAVFAIVLMLCGLICAFSNSTVGYMGAYYGNVACFYVSAILTSVGICLICALLPNIKWLNFVGKSSLCILLMHKFPILLFSDIIPFSKKLLSDGNVPFGIAVTIVSILLCLVAQLLLEKILPFTIGKKYKKRVKKAEE